MNSFRDDLLILLKKLKYKYDAFSLIRNEGEESDFPYNKIGFTEDEIKSYGIPLSSIFLLHNTVNVLLEIPQDKILEWREVEDVDEEKGEPIYRVISKNYLWFVTSSKLDEAIKIVESSTVVPTYFDESKSNLVIKNIPFSVSRKNDLSHAHYILKYIFEHNPKEEQFYSEMEKERVLGDSKKPETYYKALNTVKERLKNEHGISDFFKKISTGNAGGVQINTKYL